MHLMKTTQETSFNVPCTVHWLRGFKLRILVLDHFVISAVCMLHVSLTWSCYSDNNYFFRMQFALTE